MDTVGSDVLLRNLDKGNLALVLSDPSVNLYRAQNPADGRVPTRDRWSVLQDIQSDMRGHRSSLLYLKSLLQIAKSEIEEQGYISEEIRKRIVSSFYSWDYLFAFACAPLVHQRPRRKTDHLRTWTKKLVINTPMSSPFIDHRLSVISLFEEHALEREKLAGDAEARSFSLPPADATDKLLRYEAHLDRQLYRAMDQLERLQRQRRGENVPPPLNINLGKRS